MSPLDTRGAWEERLWSSNVPLPKRRITVDHPMYGLPRQFIVDGQALTPWVLLALVDPVPPEWLPLPEHHEAAYLSPPGGQVVRIGLVDYEHGDVVTWRKTAGSVPYRQRSAAAREDGELTSDPVDKPRRTRGSTKRRST